MQPSMHGNSGRLSPDPWPLRGTAGDGLSMAMWNECEHDCASWAFDTTPQFCAGKVSHLPQVARCLVSLPQASVCRDQQSGHRFRRETAPFRHIACRCVCVSLLVEANQQPNPVTMQEGDRRMHRDVPSAPHGRPTTTRNTAISRHSGLSEPFQSSPRAGTTRDTLQLACTMPTWKVSQRMGFSSRLARRAMICITPRLTLASPDAERPKSLPWVQGCFKITTALTAVLFWHSWVIDPTVVDRLFARTRPGAR
ncbi:hypothetical protein FB567DRAFT_41436 [Paraphoma chrysanthemicola]|uniref:Uncharacterized protein n=1 Tax=Paraphoma chrysanthemicola TaxID=798071 RepID=A0A8K0RI74_9PLEO|nr:hypothetical protein FB567DRAFT_41436 [Paraphoma chrysanthemicola]